MRIGIDCFEDVEIRSIIASGGRVGNCDVTGKNNVLIYDTLADNSTGDLAVLLSEVLDVYTPESELPSDFPPGCLAYIEEVLFSDWSIFNLSVSRIKQVIIEACKSIYAQDSLVFKEKVGLESAYVPRGRGYARQTIEIDSNNAGVSYVLAERERFADDPAYTEYLMNRVIHFENGLADYRENIDECDMFELVQVDHAARAGELGGGERMVAESYLRGGKRSR